MKIGSVNLFSYGAANKAQNKQNNASFKGWEDKTETHNSYGVGSYNQKYVVKTWSEVLNSYWKDAVGKDEKIQKYPNDKSDKTTVEHLNKVGDLLTERSLTLKKEAEKNKAASLECAQEAQRAKNAAIDLAEKQLDEEIAAKSAELEKLKAQRKGLRS